MIRSAVLLLALAALPASPAVAQDFCTALRQTLRPIMNAAVATDEASRSIGAFRGRLLRAPDLYGADAESLNAANEALFNVRAAAADALEALVALERERCAPIPE